MGEKNYIFGKENKWGRHTEKTKQIIGEKNTKPLPKELKEDKNLGYILGTVLGDGSMRNYIKNSDYGISLGVKDKDFALAFKKTLEEWSGFKVCRKKDKDKGKDFVYFNGEEYIVNLSSKLVRDFLEKYNINKIKKNINLRSTSFNKIRKFLNKSYEYKKLFLRAFYDSEGCVPKNVKDKQIGISNNSKQLLQFCKDLLLDLDIKSNKIGIQFRKGDYTTLPNGKKYFMDKNFYTFSICSKENFVKFRDRIGFSIKRKQDNLIKIICSYKYK